MQAVSRPDAANPGRHSASGTSDPIDHAHLARYTFGNRALEIEVLQLFAGQAPDYLRQLRTAETDRAWRDAAHTIKGAGRAVGAFAVAARAEEAEALTLAAGAERRSLAVAAIEAALATAIGHIEALGKA
ncbi:MAG: Hpt domain-containing protein [Hyphomicrobiaceae bacterium]|nr:Hpt domain-containing protein [Hyphomicrobiaceae bacterium]